MIQRERIFVRPVFELYATGEYTLERLQLTMGDQGLTTRATLNRPAAVVSINKLHQMLRDRYYTGRITYGGEEFPGRHPALVSDELFEPRPGSPGSSKCEVSATAFTTIT